VVELKAKIKDCPFHRFEWHDIDAKSPAQRDAFALWEDLLDSHDLASMKDIKNTNLAYGLWRVAWYLSINLPNVAGSELRGSPYQSLALTLIHFGLQQYREDASFGREYAENKAVQCVVRNLGLVYRLRVTTRQKNNSYATSTWDCVSSSIRDWVLQQSVVRSQFGEREIVVTEIEPEWSMVSEFDAGLLFSGAFFTRCLLRQFQIPDVNSTQMLRIPCFDDGRLLRNPKERYTYLRRNVKPETVRRIERTEFTNSNISYICWRFARLFGGYLQHPNGGSFIDVELCNALTCFDANLKEHGAAYAFRCFTRYIAKTLPYAYQVVIRDPKQKEHEWQCLEEPFADWLEDGVTELEVSLSLNKQDQPTPKAMYLLMRHVFDRADMGFWNIPLQGWNHPAHQWGVLI